MVPAQFKQEVEVPVSILRSKIETVALMLSVATGFIILRFENNQLYLQGSSNDVGEGSAELPVEFAGDPITASFNPTFLADPLRFADCETMTFKVNDGVSPVAIDGGDGFVYVIMPMRP